MMYWYGNGMAGWGYAAIGLANILFWVLLIAGGVAAFRHFGGPQASRVGRAPAMGPEQVLADRFARGEIDADEYHHRLATLRATTPTSSGRPAS
jgi:putative membrane protein